MLEIMVPNVFYAKAIYIIGVKLFKLSFNELYVMDFFILAILRVLMGKEPAELYKILSKVDFSHNTLKSILTNLYTHATDFENS